MESGLLTVRNYAKKKGVTTTWIYHLVKIGKLECKIIDGIKFIVI